MKLSIGKIFPVFSALAVLSCAQEALAQVTLKTVWEESVYWQGEGSCKNLFKTPAPHLPAGSPLTEILEFESVIGKYDLSQGGDIWINIRKPRQYRVEGETFSDAFTNLITNRPLQDRVARSATGNAVLADVQVFKSIRYHPVKMSDGVTYAIKPDSLSLRLSPKLRVVAWTGYAQAEDADRQLWDRHLCENYHHELGHILVAAQLIEEAEDDLLALRAESIAELQELQRELFSGVSQQIRDRQDVYHEEIDEMGLEVSHSRPYLELPFSWLSPEMSVIEAPVSETP